MPGGSKVIDARGHYVLPGGIDTHTHFSLPFMGTQTVDDFYSGTRAALAGGTTMVIDFALPTGKSGSLLEGYKKWRSLADGVACCDYGLKVIIPEFRKGKTEAEMEQLVKEHGVNGFKCFMAYKNDLMLDDSSLLAVFEKCRQLGALPFIHAENGDLVEYNINKIKALGVSGPEGHLQSRPDEIEVEATKRVITLANQTNCPVYIVHVMSGEAAEEISRARNNGAVVYGEAIAAAFGTEAGSGGHVFDHCYRTAAGHVMSPPLREDPKTGDKLINMLHSGQLQTTGSDHCVFSSEQKKLGSDDFSKIPNGVNGVEERLVVLWEKAVKTGRLSVQQFVAVTSSNAAKIFNIYPRKGRLAKGSDADILVWGPRSQVIQAKHHHSNVDFNVFEGQHVSHGPLVVVANGKVVLDETGFHVTQGNGRFVPCPPNASHVYGAIRERERQLPVKIDRSGPPPAAAAAANGVASKPLSVSVTAPVDIVNTGGGGGSGSGSQHSPGAQSSGSPSSGNFYKGHTRSGVRNQQDSSFNLSGAQVDDDKHGKSSIRVHNPPGGRSSGIW